MIRALLFGSGGPLLLDNTGKEMITATAVPGAMYDHQPATVTGYEGVGQWIPFEWSSLAPPLEPTAHMPQSLPNPMPASETAEGAVFNGTTVNLDNTDAVLYNNGPIVNSPGTGAGGLDESIIQAPLNSYGFNMNQAAPYYVADDFAVTGGTWDITTMEFYGYQTSSGNTSTMTGIYVQIWNGDPSSRGNGSMGQHDDEPDGEHELCEHLPHECGEWGSGSSGDEDHRQYSGLIAGAG